MENEKEIDNIISEVDKKLEKYNIALVSISIAYIVIVSLILYLALAFLPKELVSEESNKILLWIDKNINPNMGIRFGANGLAPFSNKLENFYELYIFPYLWIAISLIILTLLVIKSKIINEYIINNEIFKYKNKCFYIRQLKDTQNIWYSLFSPYSLTIDSKKNGIKMLLVLIAIIAIILYGFYHEKTYICVPSKYFKGRHSTNCHNFESIFAISIAIMQICLIYLTSFMLFIIFFSLKGIEYDK